jgi:hypothetical protein
MTNSSIIMSEHVANGQVYMSHLPDGTDIRDKDGRMALVNVKGLIPIVMTSTVITSESEIGPTDNVVVFANSVKDQGTTIAGIANGNVAAIADLNERTFKHEVVHQLGLGDEYIKNSDGTFTSRTSDNLMDLQGQKLNSLQAAQLLGSAMSEKARSAALGVMAVFGSTHKDLDYIKTKINQ